jgi:putative ABC transport system permease protein
VLRPLVARLRAALGRHRVDTEVDAELRFHIQMETDANVAAGMTPQEARRVAMRDLGGLAQTAEAVRHVRETVFDALARDVRIAARMFVRSPSFAVAVITTLALGIGANAAIFSVVDALLIRRLPYPDADRVVRLKGFSEQAFIGWGGPESFSVSPPELGAATVFAAIGAAVPGGLSLGMEDAERISAAAVTPGFLDALGVHPALGRFFTEREAALTPDIAVISDRLWRVRLAADPKIAGKTVWLNGRRYIVAGVMPPRVSYPAATDVWVPSAALSELMRTTPTGVVLGRLAPGVTTVQALSVVRRIETAFFEKSAAGRNGGAAAKTRRPLTLSLVSVRDELVGQVRPMVVVTAVSASLVLLVACLNAAQLLLTRVASRQGEFAVRRALGATRGQLARQVLVESLLLSLSAGLAAIPAAVWTLDTFGTLLPPALRGAFDIAINVRVVAATAAISVCTALLFGLVPALSLPGQRDGDLLRATPASSGDRFSRWFRRVLVVTQIAAALTLLAGAATVMRTVSNLMRLDIGVRPERTLTFDLMLPKAAYPSTAVNSFFTRLEERLRAIPGVEAVGSTTQMPGDPDLLISWGQVAMDGRFVGAESSMRFAARIAASPGYLAAAGIDRLAGRDFDAGDRTDSSCVVIVSEGLAKVAGTSPAGIVGRRLDHGDVPYQKGCTVVGVVRDVLLDGPERQLLGRQYTSEATLRSAVYVPYEQYGYRQRDRHIVVRARVDPRSLLPAIHAGVAQSDRSLPIYNVRTFDDIRAASLADRRFAMAAFLAFGLLATLLSVLGLYSVLAHLVQQRTREIGIRLTLGASPRSVHRLILGNGTGLASAGLVLGAAVAVASWRVVASKLPKVGQMDAATIVALAVGILAIATVATWIPARRATRVDPIVTLRSE